MMRRSLYSTDPKHSPPIIEVLWDRGALMIEAKAGTLDVKAIGPMFQKALREIQEAIIKGQSNAKKQDGESSSAGEGA
jgi:hypothetical protein